MSLTPFRAFKTPMVKDYIPNWRLSTRTYVQFSNFFLPLSKAFITHAAAHWIHTLMGLSLKVFFSPQYHIADKVPLTHLPHHMVENIRDVGCYHALAKLAKIAVIGRGCRTKGIRVNSAKQSCHCFGFWVKRGVSGDGNPLRPQKAVDKPCNRTYPEPVGISNTPFHHFTLKSPKWP